MKDRFNRNINYLRLSITNNCNYNCRYCGGFCENQVINMPMNRIIEIGKSVADLGINKIRITGGEPTIREDIVNVVSELKKIDGIDNVCITTNGWNLKEISEQLYEAGLDGINVSIDSLSREKYKEITKVDRLDAVIKSFLNAKFNNKKINVVLMNNVNTDEINDFVNLTKDNDIEVRFIEFMPVGHASEMFERYYISNDIVKQKVSNLKWEEFDGVSSLYRIDGYKGKVGLINPISTKFCSQCNKIRITTDEKIIPCLHSNKEIDICGFYKNELKERIVSAVNIKPEQHNINDKQYKPQHRDMQNIGG